MKRRASLSFSAQKNRNLTWTKRANTFHDNLVQLSFDITCSFPQDCHRCCHDMLVFRCSLSHYKHCVANLLMLIPRLAHVWPILAHVPDRRLCTTTNGTQPCRENPFCAPRTSQHFLFASSVNPGQISRQKSPKCGTSAVVGDGDQRRDQIQRIRPTHTR